MAGDDVEWDGFETAEAMAVHWRLMLESSIELLQRAAYWPARVEDKRARRADVKPLKQSAHALWNRYLSWGKLLGRAPRWSGTSAIRFEPMSDEVKVKAAVLFPYQHMVDLGVYCDDLLGMAVTGMVEEELERARDGLITWTGVVSRLKMDADAIRDAAERLKNVQLELFDGADEG